MTEKQADSFVYEADKKLFRYMRQRLVRDRLRSRDVVMSLGGEGMLVFRLRRSGFGRRYVELRAEAYDTGRVYLNGNNQLERHADTFEEVPALIAEMLHTIASYDFKPQPLRYGDWMQERTARSCPRVKTAFHQRVAAYHKVKAEAYRAYLATLPPPPPYVPPPPLPPLTPEELATRQELSDKMIKELVEEMDTNIIAGLQEAVDWYNRPLGT